MAERGRRESWLGNVLRGVVLVSFAVVSIGSFLWILSVSLKTNPEFFSTSPWALPRAPSLKAYESAWSAADIGAFFLNSVILTLLGSVFAILIAAPAAYALARTTITGQSIIYRFFALGILAPVVLVMIPLYFLLLEVGLLGTLWGLALVYVATTIPYDVFFLVPYFRTLPGELEEAAFVDGASVTTIFLKISLPLAGAGLASVGILNVLTIWNESFLAIVILDNPATYTIPVGMLGLYHSAQFSANWVELFAGLVITMIPILVFFGLMQNRISRGLTAGAVKG